MMVVVSRHHPAYMVREGSPGSLAMGVTGVPHAGGFLPGNWYQVSVFWWYVRRALFRVQTWSAEHHKQTAWYVRPVLAMLLWVASYIPKAPEK